MRDFDYYRAVHAQYYSSSQVKKELKDELDDLPLTVNERKERESGLLKLAIEKANELNKPYYAESSRLTADFWTDTREELGYGDYLTDEGVMLVEQEAYENGHSSGFSLVYEQLQNITEFALKLRGCFK